MKNSGHDVTALLQAWTEGDEKALSKLTDVVHAELKRLARWYMANERPGHTLETGALVNEAFMQLVDLKRIQWQSRTHFYAMSARMMRRVLVDYARSHKSRKRGAGERAMTLTDVAVVSSERSAEFIALDEALERLASFDQRKSQVVELRFFGGLAVDEIAEMLKVSSLTVLRDWKFAKAWLERQIMDDRGSSVSADEGV